METLMPDGQLLRERFDSMADLLVRRDELEKRGGKVQRILHVHQGGKARRPRGNPKYPLPHQGSNEVARRRRQLAKGQLRVNS